MQNGSFKVTLATIELRQKNKNKRLDRIKIWNWPIFSQLHCLCCHSVLLLSLSVGIWYKKNPFWGGKNVNFFKWRYHCSAFTKSNWIARWMTTTKMGNQHKQSKSCILLNSNHPKAYHWITQKKIWAHPKMGWKNMCVENRKKKIAGKHTYRRSRVEINVVRVHVYHLSICIGGKSNDAHGSYLFYNNISSVFMCVCLCVWELLVARANMKFYYIILCFWHCVYRHTYFVCDVCRFFCCCWTINCFQPPPPPTQTYEHSIKWNYSADTEHFEAISDEWKTQAQRLSFSIGQLINLNAMPFGTKNARKLKKTLRINNLFRCANSIAIRIAISMFIDRLKLRFVLSHYVFESFYFKIYMDLLSVCGECSLAQIK